MSVGFFNVIISEESSDITRQVSDGRLVMAHLLLFCNVACLERAPLSNLVIVKLLCRQVVVRNREFMSGMCGEKGTAGYSRVLSQGTPRQLADGKVVNLSSKERGFHRWQTFFADVLHYVKSHFSMIGVMWRRRRRRRRTTSSYNYYIHDVCYGAYSTLASMHSVHTSYYPYSMIVWIYSREYVYREPPRILLELATRNSEESSSGLWGHYFFMPTTNSTTTVVIEYVLGVCIIRRMHIIYIYAY